MPTPKCSVTILATGPGGLSTQRSCGRPAVQRYGHRGYCGEHVSAERKRLHLDELEAGARVVVTRTLIGAKYHLEPRGTIMLSRVFHELVALGWLVPEVDPLFPDLEISTQSWKLIPGASR